MSERCCKFQKPASNTDEGVAETRKVEYSVTDVRTDKGKTIWPSPLLGVGIKHKKKQ